VTERNLAWLIMLIGTGQVLLLVAALVYGLRDTGLSKTPARPGRDESRCCPALTAAQKLGATIMSVVDEALARFGDFVRGVLAKVKAAQETNDVQTAKLAELQAALAAATADDAADDAKIAELQAQVSGLQEEVAAKINAAVDALENPPVEAVEEEPVEAVEEEAPVVEESDPVVEEVVEEVPVVEDAEVPVVEEDAVVVEEAVVVDPVEPTPGEPVE
jgi:hypothetical protein